MQTNDELATLIHDSNGFDNAALMLQLWEQVNRLAMKIANKWLRALPLRSDVEFSDLMSEAYIAMCEALQGYDSEQSTFTTWYGVYLKNRYSALYGFRTKRKANEPLNNAMSLDAPLSDNAEAMTLADTIADDNAADDFDRAERELYRQQLHEALCEALSTIPSENSNTIMQRYFNGKTVNELADELNTTPADIRALEAHGLRQLRRCPTANNLRRFTELDFDFYHGTSLTTFRNTHTSIQEQYLLKDEKIRRSYHEY